VSELEWLELSCQVDREAVEPVGALFTQHGRGVVVEDVDVVEGEEAADLGSPVTVRTYLALDETAAEKQRAIALGLYLLGRLRPVGELRTKRLVEQDWAEAWKAHFHVHRVGRRTVVVPSWREYEPRPNDVVIALDPGMAFGTGLHPTTELCLEALEEIVRPGASVLDLGTGSGILAIAAAKLGAVEVVALDTDAVAVKVARANVAANGLAERIAVARGSLPLPGEQRAFGVVVANIIARVIAELAPHLAAALATDGTLVASGIIAERETEVQTALAAAGLVVAERRQRGDWLALLARR